MQRRKSLGIVGAALLVAIVSLIVVSNAEDEEPNRDQASAAYSKRTQVNLPQFPRLAASRNEVSVALFVEETGAFTTRIIQ
jgi:hypothetical protein